MRVYVSEYNNNRIQYFTPLGSFLGTWGKIGTEEGEFVNPNQIAVTADGRVFVADTSNYRIQYFTSDGKFLGKLGVPGTGEGQFNYPRGAAVTSSVNRLYVADTGNHRIQYFRKSGPVVETSSLGKIKASLQ
jgi:DNA-binding beta-propeller fold protein YncE